MKPPVFGFLENNFHVKRHRGQRQKVSKNSHLSERRCIVLPVRYELNLYLLCRRK
jgi:hypothetical protein